jgi:hypothetical protein
VRFVTLQNPQISAEFKAAQDATATLWIEKPGCAMIRAWIWK